MLNLISIHYFLWLSALVPTFGYLGVYSEYYANVSASQFGSSNMILPFVCIVAKVFFGSIADRYQAYRLVFIMALVTANIGFGSFGILPFFISPASKQGPTVMPVWIFIYIMNSLAMMSFHVVVSLTDVFSMNSAKKRNSSFGSIRFWGVLGAGLSAAVLTFINRYDKLPFLVPGLLMTITLLSLDLLLILLWPDKEDFKLEKSISNTSSQEESKPPVLSITACEDKANVLDKWGIKDEIKVISSVKLQWMIFKEVSKRRRSIFRYIILFIIAGFVLSLQWSYLYIYLRKVYPNDFVFVSALQSATGSILGQIPSLLLSKSIINVCGRSNTLTISMICMGIRYLLYEFLLPNVSMYFIIMVESLSGPCFGLFYVVMTDVGLDYANCEEVINKMISEKVVDNNAQNIDKLRRSLTATMQSLICGSFDCLGVGVGTLIGGLAIDRFGFDALWIFASILALVGGTINIVIDIFQFPCLSDLPNISETQSDPIP